MAAIVWTDVTTQPRAPASFATVDIAWQTVFLAMANTYLDVSMFDGEDGPVTKIARVLYISHMLTLQAIAGASATAGVSGPVTSLKASKLEVTYGSLGSSSGGTGSDPLGQTSYGSALLMLAWPRTRAVVLR